MILAIRMCIYTITPPSCLAVGYSVNLDVGARHCPKVFGGDLVSLYPDGFFVL
jgi:hypothetical protein